jgi:IS5 family transposase
VCSSDLVAKASLKQARKVREMLPPEAQRGLANELERFEGLVERVVGQTKRRVFDGESVPASEKLVSVFEPHTSIIRRGKKKAGKETEYGHKVWLEETEGGIISGYRLLEGNPADQDQLLLALEHHEELFGKPPRLVAADRGVYSPDNERECQRRGVERVCLPKPGKKTEERESHERQRWFRRGRRFRAGIEGRISVCKRRGFLGRCRDKGEEGFGRWVGWGVICANLSTIARRMATR